MEARRRDQGPGGGPERKRRAEVDEDELRERYRELLEELRTVLPGVQVLFAFLLTVPFSGRFNELDELGRNLFAAAMLGVALTIAAFLAPAAHHRLNRKGDREVRLRRAQRLEVAGMTLLGASVAVAVLVVVRFVFDSTAVGIGFAGTFVVVVAILWFTWPLIDRR